MKIKMELEMEWDGLTLTGNDHLARVMAETPFEEGFGWVLETDGVRFVNTGQRRVVLRGNGSGQAYSSAKRNAPCELLEGLNVDGHRVCFVLVYSKEIPATRTRIEAGSIELHSMPYRPGSLVSPREPSPVVKVDPRLAPRRLDSLEDALWYREVFDAGIPVNATVLNESNGKTFPAKNMPLAYWAHKLGFPWSYGTNETRWLDAVSLARVMGEGEEAARAERGEPVWPEWEV